MLTRRRFIHLAGISGLFLLGGCKPTTQKPSIQEINVALTEWAIEPDMITVKAGTIRFVVRNLGTMAHGFEIEGEIDGKEFEREIEPFPAGQTRRLMVELPPGEYEIYCQVPGHKEKGMEGTLIVEAR